MKYYGMYKMWNGTFFRVYQLEDGTLVDENKVEIDEEELNEYVKVD